MLSMLGALVLWLIQIVGTWVLVGLTVVALFLRTSFPCSHSRARSSPSPSC